MEMTVSDARRTSTRMSLRVALLSLATMSWTACGDAARITRPGEDAAILVVSDPAVIVAAELGGIGTVRSVVGAATADVTYVSLPPGTLGEATLATVRNPSTHAQSTVAVIDGGFDPVAIAAAAGDTIHVESLGPVGESMALAVPVRRPPQLIRTYPQHGKRDVPLNSRILVVFSEPLDRQSVNESTVQLLRANVVVPGRVELDDAGLTI